MFYLCFSYSCELKKKIIHTLGPFTGLFPVNALRKLTGKHLIFPFYHSVAYKSLPHIDSLYTLRTEELFKKDIDFLLTRFNPIDPQKALTFHFEKKSPSKPSFLLSFDDGLSGFYHHESQLLYKKGIPAIIFLNSAFIDNKELFYRYKASLLINHLRENPETIKLISVFLADNGIVKKDLFDALLAINYQNQNLLDKIANICQYSFKDFLKNNQPYLTTEQIKELSQKGFLFGAHSIDHPKYSEISFEEQLKQTQLSIEFVKNQFRQSLSLFAFPFTDDGVSEKLFQTIFDPKESIVDFSFGGAGLKNEILPGHIQRIPMEGINASCRKIIKTEYLYYMTKSLFGKNTIHRS
jgi:peptidoglycan/xylan/chitin deacetylase (PgdA/CDA1 family)